jgi:hypothetical protein
MPTKPRLRGHAVNDTNCRMGWRPIRQLSVLDFDIECRPLSWYGGDWVTKEVTAIGCQWVTPAGDGDWSVWLLGEDEPEAMLVGFREWFDRADMVTGHYISGFDLPVLNGAMIEFGLPPLGSKMTSDTKRDLVRFSGLSKSQENLAALFELEHPKVQMNQAKWRSANRLEPEGIEMTYERVIGDVRQHIELRAELIRRQALGPAKMWRPDSRPQGYVP